MGCLANILCPMNPKQIPKPARRILAVSAWCQTDELARVGRAIRVYTQGRPMFALQSASCAICGLAHTQFALV